MITFYKQHEREQKADEATGEIYIETTIEDIEEANELMKEILLRKSDELSGACRNYFEQLKEWLEKNKQSSFTNTSIRNQLRIPISSVKRYHTALLSAGLIRKMGNRNTKAYHYETVSTEEYTKLQNSIGSALDEALQKIKYPPIGSISAHKQNEPRKRRIISHLHEQPTGV